MPVTIMLESEVESHIEDLARQTGQDKAAILKMAIENGIDDIDDYFRASQVLNRIKKGEERTYSSREVRDELGLED